MKKFTLNFEQSGSVTLPLSFFTDPEKIHEEMESKLEAVMGVKTESGTLTSVDWLDRMVMIYSKNEESVVLFIGGEASVTVTCKIDINDTEDFGYQNLALFFDDKTLEDRFSVKHSEVIA